MPPPTSSRSTFGSSDSMTASLSDTLEPPSTTTYGRSGSPVSLLQHLDLGQHQPAGVGGQQLGDVVHRGLLAVHHTETVGHERAVRRRRAPRGRRPARRARPRPCWSRARRSGCSPAARPRRPPSPSTVDLAESPTTSAASVTVASSSSFSRVATGLQRVLRVRRALRPAEVRGDHDPRTRPGQLADGGQRRADPAVVGDGLAVERHVQVGAQQHAPTRHTLGEQIVERLHRLPQSLDATSAVRSARRLE